jgi:hypothetical protein
MSLVTLTEIKQMWKKLHARPTKDELIKMMKKLQLAVGEKKNKELQDKISVQLDDWEEMLKEEEAKKKREEEVKKKGKDKVRKKPRAGEMEQVCEGSSKREPAKTKKQTAKADATRASRWRQPAPPNNKGWEQVLMRSSWRYKSLSLCFSNDSC